MTLKDLLKKKDKSRYDGHAQPVSPGLIVPPEFKFIRSDTHTQEAILPPSFGDSPTTSAPEAKPFGRLHRSSNASNIAGNEWSPPREKGSISHRLHLGRRSRSGSTSSINLPTNLPAVEENGDAQEREAQWEKRATLLAQEPMNIRPSSPRSPSPRSRSSSMGRLSGPEDDVNIQEAIKLHEAGELTKSTMMFGRLADPNGQNNALSQVLYGLALRHGWGCKPNHELAITYLSAAAANSASIEAEALRAGIKKGGAAKGELVLAIFELANCLRHGWGVSKDPVAARQYYETAANLGDADAMNEAAWCYLEGFGGKKNKYIAAKYYRLAEENGNKTLGNTWIWKEKYNSK
ncbi:predicted protein [Uncinocarpus reesii 1704]|uniref:HCP-like protein n=1 Tax=Uncinocarpus reesii (strain UAMH 1704) TaxID=336963 RepID=C4JIW9_UNCRE|nr:uncharacterized protein UREG_01576 [Uncinocarpus reesii 1704]EEP76727.1 predicted protein [Uncinocarpus reesii 1704]